MEVIVAGGYAKMSIDDVARHARVPLRTAMRLTSSPSELFKVAIQDWLDTFLSRIAFAVNGRDQRATLREILLSCARFVLDKDVVALNRIVISERDVYPEIAEIFYAEGVERVPVTLAAWLSSQRDLGTIDIVDCHDAARMLIGMVTSDIQRGALLGRRLPPAAEITRRADLCATVFLNGCAIRQ